MTDHDPRAVHHTGPARSARSAPHDRDLAVCESVGNTLVQLALSTPASAEVLPLITRLARRRAAELTPPREHLVAAELAALIRLSVCYELAHVAGLPPRRTIRGTVDNLDNHLRTLDMRQRRALLEAAAGLPIRLRGSKATP